MMVFHQILLRRPSSCLPLSHMKRFITSEPTSNAEMKRVENELKQKTISEKFTEALERGKEIRKLNKANKSEKYNSHNQVIKPVGDYTPRFTYNGYLRRSRWVHYDENHPKRIESVSKRSGLQPRVLSEAALRYIKRKRRKFCLLIGFAGANYYGMQYNESVPTIENELLKAMLKNEWILEEHEKKPWMIEYQHGSRTDRGVSAARQNVSMLLPIDVSVEDINKDLPADIRVFGMKQTTPKFDARFNCSARTYSYTLPTIAFSEYNDQTKMEDYRVTSDRLKTVSDVLSLFEGQTNFHNYTVKKQYFDRSSQRRIDFIKCSEPFIENDVEFSRITVKGESFMLHQIRRMIGFGLAVIRGVVDYDLLNRSLTDQEVHTPTAPGLGLMLERLHFTQYANVYKTHNPLTFDEYDDAVERFRHEQIHPIIVQTEINERSMEEWLELLCIHEFDGNAKENEYERKFLFDREFDVGWGEDPEFIDKLKKINVEEQKR